MTNDDHLELGAGGIPISLAPVLQEYDFRALNADQHGELVIERTLSYGDRLETQWLFRRYGRAPIGEWFRQRGAARLSRWLQSPTSV